MINSGIYKIKNIITKDFYTGSAINFRTRWNEHRYDLRRNLHWNTHLQNAWNKYGESAFEFSILLYCDIENLLYYEQAVYDGLKPTYNICPKAGNCLGRVASEETKQKMSEAHKGIYPSPDARRKMSEAKKGNPNGWLGTHHSEETKRKMSEASKGELNNMFGKHHSEETKRKMSETKKGKPGTRGTISQETLTQR